MTDRLTNEQIDDYEYRLRIGQTLLPQEIAALAAQAKLAAQSPPVAALPPRADLEALTCTATREPEFGNRLKAVLEITDYADALRAAASGLGAQLKLRDELFKEMSEEDEAIRKMVADFDTTDSLNYDDTAAIVERAIYGYKTEIAAAEQRADGLASENQRLKELGEQFAKESSARFDEQFNRAESAEASAQAERERVREVERDAARYRRLRSGAFDPARLFADGHVEQDSHTGEWWGELSELFADEHLDQAIDAALPPAGEG